jgi:hypothetical protein
MLWAPGFDTALIGGTVAGVCCESSARQAMMRNNFGDVMTMDQAIERLNAAASGVAA